LKGRGIAVEATKENLEKYKDLIDAAKPKKAVK